MRRIRRQPRRQPARVLRRQQDRWVRQAPIGLGDASVALAPGHLDRLDLRVQAIDRRVHRPVERCQDVQCHERRDALRVRRDRGDLDAGVGRGDGLDPLAAVGGDVVGGHHPAGRLDGPRDLLADRPVVVGLAPAVRDRAQRRSQERLAEGVARTAGRGEDRAGCVVEGGERSVDGAGGDVGERVAVSGGARGGRERIGQGAAAESVEQLDPGIDRAGDVDCQWPALRHRLVAGCADAVDRQGGGGAAAAVEAAKSALGWIPDEGEGVAAEAAGVAVDDGEHRVGGDRGVDGRAAGTKGLDARGRGHWVRRHNHAVGSRHGGHGPRR